MRISPSDQVASISVPLQFVMIAAVALVYLLMLLMLLKKQKPDRHHTPFAAA